MPLLNRAAAGALALALLAGCATTNMGSPGDPLERMNRATYRFNNGIDRAVLRPVARGYRDHVPHVVQEGIDNFLDNLAYTTTIVNDLLQLKIKDTLIYTLSLHDARHRRPARSRVALRHPAQRRGLRSDARALGCAVGALSRDSLPRAVEPAGRAIPVR